MVCANPIDPLASISCRTLPSYQCQILDAHPVALGEKCSEGPAVSRKRMYIIWTQGGELYSADIVYQDDKPMLAKKKKVLAKKDLPFQCDLETQNIRPPAERELIFSAYGYQGTEVCGLDLRTGRIVNYSMAPDQYDEPEGIFPDGRHTLVECDKHSGKGVESIDLYKLALDGSGRTQRLTFFADYPGYKASNPVVSDDGRFIAFQVAKSGDPAGVGRGILLFDIEKFEGRSDAEDAKAEDKQDQMEDKVEKTGDRPEGEDKPEEPNVAPEANEPPAVEKTVKTTVDAATVQKNEKVDEKALTEPQTLEERIEKIAREYGVKVHQNYDAKVFFPPEWLAPPISGEGSQMLKGEVERSIEAVEKFLPAYPKEVLAKNLTDIYLVSGMKFYGKGFGAAYGKSAIYVNNEGRTRGYTQEFLLSQMHSELSSIFLTNYSSEFPSDAWKSGNPPGWRYNGTGVEMLGQSDIFGQTDELLSRGFLVKYSQSSLENDVNMFAFWAFTKGEKLKELASKYARIGRKFDLVVEFYRGIHPGINISAEPETSSLVNCAPPQGVLRQSGG